jgi:hypothetical protein
MILNTRQQVRNHIFYEITRSLCPEWPRNKNRDEFSTRALLLSGRLFKNNNKEVGK